MRSVCLIFLSANHFDLSSLMEQSLRKIGVEVQSINIRYEWMFDLDYVKKLKRTIGEKSKASFVVFFSDSTELFFEHADLHLLFSAYSGWFNVNKMYAIPHMWTPLRPPHEMSKIRWNDKPPLRVGFMGRTFRSVTAAKIATQMPLFVRKWLLGGSLNKAPELVALLQHTFGHSMKSMNAFSRLETIRALERFPHPKELELEIIETDFGGSRQELEDYANHLRRNTYIVCSRGTENFSYRMYEALSFGRIPVIIDTNVVLPKEIDWDSFAIRIPYMSLSKIYDIISDDYYSHSRQDFIMRQLGALTAILELNTLRWIDDLALQLRARLH